MQNLALAHRRVSYRAPSRRASKTGRKPETVRRICDAAELAFAEQGLAGARTDEIARGAGVNKALLYYYFHSKDDLYAAVLEGMFLKQQAAIESARTATSPPQSLSKHRATSPHQQELRAYVNGAIDFVVANPHFPRLIQREMMNRSPQVRHLMRRFWLPTYKRLENAIRRGIKSGEFRHVDAEHAVFSIIAMTVFYFAAAPMLKDLLGRDTLNPRAVAARRKAILDFMEHALFAAVRR
jgi:TetR/AcrR family transcriptional regulator